MMGFEQIRLAILAGMGLWMLFRLVFLSYGDQTSWMFRIYGRPELVGGEEE